MKGQLSWFVLFLTGIVAADELPPEYLTDCQFVVEAQYVAGIYVYIQPLEIIEGFPTVARVQKTEVPGKKNFDFDDSATERLRIAWSSWHSWGFRFIMRGRVLLVETKQHFCLRTDGDTPQYWAILNDTNNYIAGWATLTNDLAGVSCNPDVGRLNYMSEPISPLAPKDESAEEYIPLPTYRWFRLVYDCVTHLRKLELSSGVATKATAASLDTSGNCRFWYQPHSALRFLPNFMGFHERVCFLEETPGLIATPLLGLYSSCKMYMVHPFYPGEFTLSDTFLSDNDANLHGERAELALNGIVNIIPETTYELTYEQPKSFFTPSIDLNPGYSTKIHAATHVCMGPDLGQVFSVTDSDPAIVNTTMMRVDEGLPCTPVYGKWVTTNKRFSGYVTKDSIHSITECIAAVKDIPNSDWKAYVIDVVSNFCIAYGGGLHLSEFRRDDDYENEAYTCVVDHSETYEMIIGCEISIESKQYTGLYIVDDIFAGNYSRYASAYRLSYELDTNGVPQVIPTADGTYNVDSAYMEKIFGTNNYMLKGLDEKFVVEVDAICYTGVHNYNRPILYNNVKLGVMNTDTVGCYPMREKRQLSDSSSFQGYFLFSENIESLVDCNTQADLAHSNGSWAAYVRNGSSCVVYGAGLDDTDLIDVPESVEDEYYSCMLTVTTSDTIVGPGCVVTVEDTPSYGGVYTPDLTFKDNSTAVPYLRRKTMSLDNLNDIVYGEFDSAYIHLEADSEGVEMLMLSGLSDAGNKIISTSAHLCEEEFVEGQKYSSKFTIRDPETNLDSGIAYKVSVDNACYPVSVMRSPPLTFAGYQTVSQGDTFYDCQEAAIKATSNTKWMALKKVGEECAAFGLGLDTSMFYPLLVAPGMCIFPTNFSLPNVRAEINMYCLVVVYGRENYHGPYKMDLTYSNNFNSQYPRMYQTGLARDDNREVIFGNKLSNYLTFSRDQGRMTFNSLNLYFETQMFPCLSTNLSRGPWPVYNSDGSVTGSEAMIFYSNVALQMDCRSARGDIGQYHFDCSPLQNVKCRFGTRDLETCA